jgi:hypothetical protein
MARFLARVLLAWAIVPHLPNLGAAEYFIDCHAAGRPIQVGSVDHPWSDRASDRARLGPFARPFSALQAPQTTPLP